MGGQNGGGRELEGGERECNPHVFHVVHHLAKYCKSSSGNMGPHKLMCYYACLLCCFVLVHIEHLDLKETIIFV